MLGELDEEHVSRQEEYLSQQEIRDGRSGEARDLGNGPEQEELGQPDGQEVHRVRNVAHGAYPEDTLMDTTDTPDFDDLVNAVLDSENTADEEEVEEEADEEEEEVEEVEDEDPGDVAPSPEY